jgi:hypothetical protein
MSQAIEIAKIFSFFDCIKDTKVNIAKMNKNWVYLINQHYCEQLFANEFDEFKYFQDANELSSGSDDSRSVISEEDDEEDKPDREAKRIALFIDVNTESKKH